MTSVVCPHGHWTPYECLSCQRGEAKRKRREPARLLVFETARVVAELAARSGVDTSRLEKLLEQAKADAEVIDW